MNLKEALYAELSTHAGLTALVGTRIEPGERPQGDALPAVTFQTIATPKVRSFGGGGSDWPRIQINVWAETQEDADAVALQVGDCLDWFSGTLGGDGGLAVELIENVNQMDLPGDSRLPKRVVMEFKIMHERVTA